MKNLDLNKYGVQEMNTGEMIATEGGDVKTYTALVGNPISDVCISISNAAKWVHNCFE